VSRSRMQGRRRRRATRCQSRCGVEGMEGEGGSTGRKRRRVVQRRPPRPPSTTDGERVESSRRCSGSAGGRVSQGDGELPVWPLVSLGDEMVLRVLGKLSAGDVGRVACTSRAMRLLASTDALWGRLYALRWGGVAGREAEAHGGTGGGDDVEEEEEEEEEE